MSTDICPSLSCGGFRCRFGAFKHRVTHTLSELEQMTLKATTVAEVLKHAEVTHT